MHIESVTIKGFRCFGSDGTRVRLSKGLTALVGANGAGKTAFLLALSRVFGVSDAQRRVVLRDFHVPLASQNIEDGARFSIDVVLAFRELAENAPAESLDAVPEFFRQMWVDTPGDTLRARLMLAATWSHDGRADGFIEEDCRWLPTLGDDYDWDKCARVQPSHRSAIQVNYVPATRSMQEPIAALLRGRLWKAAHWSEDFAAATEGWARSIQGAFEAESPTRLVREHVAARWRDVHDGDTDAQPNLRVVEDRFEGLVRRVDFSLFPDEAGREREMAELSDGQRSLFHLALTAAALDIERRVFDDSDVAPAGFLRTKLQRVYLTILAIEEPENSLSPFLLSRIILQARDISKLQSAQVIISSHSSAILSRVEPEEVRYFRLLRHDRLSAVLEIRLPPDGEEAQRYIRLAVRAYPELYFAKFVILCEGDSERIVIPRIAEAMGVPLDPSFVPVVPLGSRFVGHFWQLLNDLGIPFATLLDLDLGRAHGGAELVRSTARRMVDHGFGPEAFPREADDLPSDRAIINLTDADILASRGANQWLRALAERGVYFSGPLDLDFSMEMAFPDAYRHPRPGGSGPSYAEGSAEGAKVAALKDGGDPTLYGVEFEDHFRWYRYLFLGGSKPDAHVAALARLEPEVLAAASPRSLRTLILRVQRELNLQPRSADT